MSSHLHAGSYSTSSSSTFTSPPSSPLLGYNETDPFLVSRSGQLEPPPSPSSRSRPPSPSPYERSFSPGILDHLVIPPQAKRQRSKATLLLAFAALIAVSVLAVQAADSLPSQPKEKVLVVSEKLRQSLMGFRDAWRSGGGSAEAVNAESEPGELLRSSEGDRSRAGEALEGVGEHQEATDVTSSTSAENDPPRSFNVSAFPRIRAPSGDPDERFIGYLPHSGFHNQRSELQNALLLGKLLNRTVLLPPVWVGWPTSTQFYDDLAKSWTDAIALNPSSFGLAPSPPESYLNTPAHYPSTVAEFPFPTSDADDPSLVATRLASQAKKAARWRALGWEVRPDGYPITNMTASECKSYSVECRHTYKDSFLSWDWIADLSKIEAAVRLVDRWDVRDRALEELLGVTAEDVYVLSDRKVYDLKFTDAPSPEDPLITPDDTEDHWSRLVSLDALAKKPQRVLLVGSLFGSGRISTDDPRAPEWRETFEQGLAFRNPWLLKPADEIRDRLGGSRGYVGVHARVGDGVFKKRAPQNMERAWKNLVEKLGVDAMVAEEMWARVKPAVEEADEVVKDGRMRRVAKRSLSFAEPPSLEPLDDQSASDWALVDSSVDINLESSTVDPSNRAHTRRSLFSALTAAFAPPPKLTSLTCRSPLHSSDFFAPFNTPLYLATDSRSPTEDPNLAIFFAAFPCTFILSDFDRPSDLNDDVVVSSVGDMSKLVNQADGMPLGRLLLPFLEAIIAAKGSETVGTYGSTFSDFAQGGLHDAYAADD